MNQKSYHEWSDTLNKNPVFDVEHFQYRVEQLFKTTILHGALGKTNYHATRVEFQVRISPHVDSFIWILNVPKLSKFNKDEYKN